MFWTLCLITATTILLCWGRIAAWLKREKKIEFSIYRDVAGAAQRRASVGGR
jgi:hypothetical protein